MICKIQAVTLGEGGREEIREIACLERTDLKPETLGLTLAEGKAILKGLQRVLPSRFWHKWLTDSMMRLFFASPVAIQTPEFLLTYGRFRTS